MLIEQPNPRQPGVHVYAKQQHLPPPKPASGSDLTFCLVRGGRKTLPLSLAENMIGRNPNLPISIDDTSIAQHHATITIENGQAFI